MQLLEEFFRQGDKERKLGLPFSPLCDRNNTLVAESQIGFIEFIVEPSMQVCSDMLETVLAPLNVKDTTDESNNGKISLAIYTHTHTHTHIYIYIYIYFFIYIYIYIYIYIILYIYIYIYKEFFRLR